jgi:hypothetical protein
LTEKNFIARRNQSELNFTSIPAVEFTTKSTYKASCFCNALFGVVGESEFFYAPQEGGDAEHCRRSEHFILELLCKDLPANPRREVGADELGLP